MPTESQSLLTRTIGCGEVTEAHATERTDVVLTGWVQRRRDLGQLIFLEMRDATGFVQVVFDPSRHADSHAIAESLRNEYVIGVRGAVVPRESPNPDHPTGMVEVLGEQVVVHNRADAVPFPVEDETTANEEVRLTHRYVDLRRPAMQRAMRLRARLASKARQVLDERGFVDIETPILTRSTPEGARDYLVPSRIHEGSFYALPQSPQLFKQLLMVAGFEKYYQFARCFRDEDLRADRQPEFTQIDVELSFATPEQVYEHVEAVMAALFREIEIDVPRPFPRISYRDAMDRFGCDRPDARFALELRDVARLGETSGFKVFDNALDGGGSVRGIAVPGGGTASRKQLDVWTEWAKEAGAGGLVWVKIAEDGTVTSTALKILGAERCKKVAESVGAGNGDAALVVADTRDTCNRVLGILRLKIAAERELIPANTWNLLWVEEFPLLDWDSEAKRWVSVHHPFTAPNWDEMEMLETEPGAVRSQAYDLVLNGTEIAGGSIRIHRREVQEKVFRALGISAEEAEEKFGFLQRALASGAPPHGGIAFGFDRICALLTGVDSIRDVIAFPKTTSATCLMTQSPSAVDPKQLRELYLKVVRNSKTKTGQ